MIIISFLSYYQNNYGLLILHFTIDVAVAGHAGLLSRFPVVVLSAALAVGPVSVVSAAHTAPPTAGAPVLLHVEHAVV